MSDRLKILIVSSKGPRYSANLGGDIAGVLKKHGCEVDFLTRYKSEGDVGFNLYSVYDCEEPESAGDKLEKRLPVPVFKMVDKCFKAARRWYREIVYMFSKKRKLSAYAFNKGFVYPEESRPAISDERLLTAIPSDKKYDLIITLFWQGMINSTSVRTLYNEYNVPVYIYSVDMAPMTGGCFYFNSCDHYKHECGQCPCLLSSDRNDISHNNYVTKLHNYSDADIFYLGNSWMLDKARASRLFGEDKLLHSGIIIDENSFYPAIPDSARKQLGLPAEKDLIVLARSSAEYRKGSHILSYAIKHVWDDLSQNKRKRFLVLIIGDNTLNKNLRKDGIPVMNLGYVNKNTLVTAYQASSLFLNPSTDDAGPSMVNQSIMCGTPVVSYNIGTASDVIENGVSGFKTDDITKEAFAYTLKSAIDAVVDGNFPQIMKTTREKALEHNSPEVFADKLLNHYLTRFHETV